MDSSSSSSSSLSRNWRFNVFPSFCGEDLRKTFLSHFLKELQRKGISTFIDNEIKRSHSIGPELVRAIRDSRISVILLSKNYASSTWCLNELLEIISSKEEIGQTVMTVFYEVDPSHVRKQTGDFGKVFEETCVGKSEDVIQRWTRALIDVSNLAGVDSRLWNNEAEMVEKLAVDISNALNVTPSRDFDDLVGIEAHLTELNPLLSLGSSEVRMVGIWGPAGIGKTTIARALYDRFSLTFQHSAFMENIRETYRRINLDEYGSKLLLRELYLSKLINQKDIKIPHLGVVRERLEDKRVLVVLDDVDELEQLNALAKEPRWFGSGSRIVVTTQNKQLLRSHGIDCVYKVEFPSRIEALQIFCQSAFGQKYPCVGIRELALQVTDLAGYLPLGLTVLGSYLRGFSKEEWENAMPRLSTSLDGKVEKTLRFSYDDLHAKDQAIFLHIACLFNGKNVEEIKRLLANRNLDVDHGLKALADKSLIDNHWGHIHMHSLLQKMGREIIYQQSIHEPGKRQFLVDAEEIRDVLAYNSGTGTVLGISFNVSKINEELSISKKAFQGMPNLQFLEIYKNRRDARVRLNLPHGLNYLSHKLRLLHWDSFPMKSLPSKFCPEFLVELRMTSSKLEKLWEGMLPLRNLKLMDLSYSRYLKEIPHLSNAKNLRKFSVDGCESLSAFPHVPDSIEDLELSFTGIEEVPTWIGNLSRLHSLHMMRCPKLTKISMNISKLENLEVIDFSGSVCGIPFSAKIDWVSGVKKCLTLRANNIEEMLPKCLPKKAYTSPVTLDLSCNKDIKTIPDCIKHLSQLHKLDIGECRKLISLPQLPDSLSELNAQECESLERISGSFHNPEICLNFANCLKLNQEARELIYTSASKYAILPGEQQPAMFTDQASVNGVKVHMIQNMGYLRYNYKAYIMLIARSAVYDDDSGGIVRVACCIRRKNDYSVVRDESKESHIPVLLKDHLFTLGGSSILDEDNDSEVEATFSELLFEFKANMKVEIIGCQFTGLGGKRNDAAKLNAIKNIKDEQ